MMRFLSWNQALTVCKTLMLAGACALTPAIAAGADAEGSASELAGRYRRTVTVRDLGSEDGPIGMQAEDVVEIVSRPGGRAWFRISLAFDNGHSCELTGTARQTRAGLIYRGEHDADTGRQCVFRLWREGHSLHWSDGNNSCISHCGMRGRLSAGSMPYSARRPIARREARRLMREASAPDLP